MIFICTFNARRGSKRGSLNGRKLFRQHNTGTWELAVCICMTSSSGGLVLELYINVQYHIQSQENFHGGAYGQQNELTGLRWSDQAMNRNEGLLVHTRSTSHSMLKFHFKMLSSNTHIHHSDLSTLKCAKSFNCDGAFERDRNE